jgi:nucleolar pre-ribosomal-associated protein 1
LEAVLEQLDIDEYIVQSPWTESSIKIISALIYRSSSASGRFGDWLRTGAAEQQDLKNVIVPLHGFLDSHSTNQGPLTDDIFHSFFPKLTQFFFDGGGDDESRSVCGKCLSLMIQLSSASARDSLLQSLQRRIQSLPVWTLKVDLLSLGERLGSSGLEVTGAIIDQGLQWAVRTISDSTLDNPEARDIFKHLSKS